jgi:hypothetical protein
MERQFYQEWNIARTAVTGNAELIDICSLYLLLSYDEYVTK